MFATLTIGGKKLKLLSNGATAIYYKQVFKKDLLLMMLVSAPKGEMNDAEAVEMAQELCFIMASQAAKEDMMQLSYEKYIAWLEGISQIGLIEKSFDIIDVFKENMQGLSDSKKKADQPSAD